MEGGGEKKEGKGGKRKRRGRGRGKEERKDQGCGKRAGRWEKGREDTCTSCHRFYITSLLKTDLQNFIGHNNFGMC